MMDFDELDQAINKLKVTAEEEGINLREIAGNTFELFGVEIQVKGFAHLGESKKAPKDHPEFDFEGKKKKEEDKKKSKKPKVDKSQDNAWDHGGINENQS